MEKTDLDKLADLFFACYERKFERLDLPENHSETYKKFAETLSEKQLELYFDFDMADLEYHIASQKHAIKFMLDLLCTEP